MFKIKNLTVRNFMSVGNATQAIDFDRHDLTLVLGENLDLGGDGSRNGTGKTTIINALSYALYGQALTNIRKDNLVNKTNVKGMLVSLEFDVSGVQYRVERGRKPNIFKFYVNNQVQVATDADESQGDSRETQHALENVLGMSHDMFKHILALNTYTEPFLSLKANDQRNIIEQLLGITLLSEKADRVKELNRETKDLITKEEFRIRAVQDANKRIQEQIDAVKRRQQMWISKKDDDLNKLAASLVDHQQINVDAEIQAHKDHKIWEQKRKDINDLAGAISRTKLDLGREEKNIAKLIKDIAALENHTCHACGQDLHDSKHEEVLAGKQQDLATAQANAYTHADDLASLESTQQELGTLGKPPKMYYDREEDAIQHRATLANLQQQIANKMAEIDPYAEQIVEMESQAIETVDYETLNALTRLQEHQDFLLKLLTSKDSFIRKKIIEQNLSYLNSRLTYYLDRIGLPHQVVFQNDLTVEITELGRDLDFDNLSRGERNRLILSMSWAFRDVWESLYQPINVLFIDELVDSGMDTQGVENSLALLKKMSRERNKSIWLVSHRDELAGRVENILKVIKENGFTSYNTDVETA
jgi:DNA repair exonuclease SbcCD ATPase subunit